MHPTATRPTVTAPATVALGTLLCLAAACIGGRGGAGGPGSGGEGTEPVPVRRIVLVTIDTLRADHLGSFGYPLPTSEFIDGLAASGVSFGRAMAHSATTGPSHASMFTGLYPTQHRVLTNGQLLDDEFVTVAEVLRERGFTTAAMLAGKAHFSPGNMLQGFDVVDEPRLVSVRAGGAEHLEYRPAADTTDVALDWLGGVAPEEPFFLWMHYYDPHQPFREGREWLDRLRPTEGDAAEAWRRHLRDVQRIPLDEDATLEHRVLQYDGEIAYVDAQIRRLYESMAERGLGERTLWVVTSDHGQGLGNHGWFGHHEVIYNEELHVPLIVHLQGAAWGGEEWLPPGRVVEDRLVEHVDLAPTLLELALGPASPAGERPRSTNGEPPRSPNEERRPARGPASSAAWLAGQPVPVQGRSLLPLLRGDAGDEHKRFAFSVRRQRAGRRARLEPGAKYALQDLTHKYIWWSDGPDELYDLVADPRELDNLVGRGRPREAELREALLALVEATRTPGVARDVDAETLERLRSLGYVE